MIENILLEVFIELGLSNFDLEVYQNIINSKVKSVTLISKNLNAARSKVYQSLHVLHDSQIIIFQPFAKSKILLLNPQNVLTKLKYKHNRINNLSRKFESIIPDLKGEYNFGVDKVITEFSGFSGLYRLLHQILDEIPAGGEYVWFNESTELSYFFKDFFFGEYSTQRAIKKINCRILENPINTILKQHIQPNDHELRYLKYLPDTFKESSTFTVFEDSVIFWNISMLKAYLIRDKMLAITLGSVFEGYWNT